jgi:hypothetical protein
MIFPTHVIFRYQLPLNDAKALKISNSNHFLKVTQSYPRVQTKHCSLDIFLVESSSFLIISSKTTYWLCGAEPVARVLDGPYSQLSPLSGVAVQASHASLHTL